MINLYSDKEIKIMREGGLILNKILQLLKNESHAGATGNFLNNKAAQLIKNNNVNPSFLNYNSFPAVLCVSINDEIVHGIPNDTVLCKGDLLGLDLGIKYKGLNLDKAISFQIDDEDANKRKFLETVRQALDLAIKQTYVGNKMGMISNIIQKTIENAGYSVAEGLFGHGVGKKVHEEPHVPNTGQPSDGIILQKGMVIAIEPMAMMDQGAIIVKEDGQTIASSDGSLACHFEDTVAITQNGPNVLTRE